MCSHDRLRAVPLDVECSIDAAVGAADYSPGWYVCPSIPEGAIIDHRIRGPFDTCAEAFAVSARLELTEP